MKQSGRMKAPSEETLWKGSPSAALDFWLILSCLLILPIPWAIARWIQRRNEVIEITNQRLRVTRGILSKRTDELELYRVRDITFLEPLMLRMFHRGTLILTTGDVSSPEIRLEAIPSDQGLRDQFRNAVEECRDRKRARVAEIEGSTGEPHSV
jgi:uncharacterized membrane protein YdbT with pleckstrin-like domain